MRVLDVDDDSNKDETNKSFYQDTVNQTVINEPSAINPQTDSKQTAAEVKQPESMKATGFSPNFEHPTIGNVQNVAQAYYSFVSNDIRTTDTQKINKNKRRRLLHLDRKFNSTLGLLQTIKVRTLL